MTAYEFPTRRTPTWALPLAVPTHIIAFAYLDLLHPIGPIQTGLRAILGYDSPRQFRLPDLRSIQGAIFVLGFVLYPYVYLSTRVMFMTQAASLLEAARPRRRPRRRVLPGGAAGASGHRGRHEPGPAGNAERYRRPEFLGVQTLTVSVYTTWVTRSDLAGAAQIALTMLAIVVGLILLERHGRKRQRYANTQRMRPMQPRRLRGPAALVRRGAGLDSRAAGLRRPCAVPGGGNLQAPASGRRRVGPTAGRAAQYADRGLLRNRRHPAVRPDRRLPDARCAKAPPSIPDAPGPHGQPGYAVPGTVLAIGLLTPSSGSTPPGRLFGGGGLLLMGSTGALVCAYAIRFLAISTGAIEAGLARIPPSLEQASRMLGETSAGTLRRVHFCRCCARPWRPARAAGVRGRHEGTARHPCCCAR